LRLLGDLRDKRVLDIGCCGEGTNSILLAKLGAQVTGVDISPKSIELAERRAEINQVTGSYRFLCSPLETAELEQGSFDIIWGDAILHHVIADLANVLSRLTLWTKPGALMVFGEPVNFNETLRRIRFMVPVKRDVSPDEHPLEFGEIAILRHYIPDRFVLVKHKLEKVALGSTCNYLRYGGLRCDGADDSGNLAVGRPRGFVRASSANVS